MRLEKLNARALRCIFNKWVPLIQSDHAAYGLTLSNRRLQDIAILIYKAANGMLAQYISDLYVVRNNVKCLRGTNKLVVPRKSTTNFGLKSTTFVGSKLKCGIRIPYEMNYTMTILREFRNAVRVTFVM